jgi:hypothetical protein
MHAVGSASAASNNAPNCDRTSTRNPPAGDACAVLAAAAAAVLYAAAGRQAGRQGEEEGIEPAAGGDDSRARQANLPVEQLATAAVLHKQHL